MAVLFFDFIKRLLQNTPKSVLGERACSLGTRTR